jgi:hypothetical protein
MGWHLPGIANSFPGDCRETVPGNEMIFFGLMGRLRNLLKAVPYSNYLAYLARSRYSPSIGWYSRLRDAKIARTSFFDRNSMSWYITPTNQRV